MRCLVRAVAQHRSGAAEIRDTEYAPTDFSLGSASTCTLLLEGSDVAPVHARIRLRRDGQAQIRAIDGARLLINDQEHRSLTLNIGDRIQIGGHQLTVFSPPPGFDLALTLDAADTSPIGGGLEFTLGATSLAEAGWGRRRLAWLLMTVMLFTGVLLPWYWSRMPVDQLSPSAWPVTDAFWSTGPLHRAHRIPALANNCRSCHQVPFQPVTDAACEQCHQVADHAANALATAHRDASTTGTQAHIDLTDQTCAGCHREHNEPATLVRQDERLCVTCHAELTITHSPGDANRPADAPATPASVKLAAVPGFDQHPEFRVSLQQTAADGSLSVQRLALDDPQLVERSQLNFSHQQHLNPLGIDGPQGRSVLACADCHTTEQNGLRMQPITMQQHCASCHSLAFEPTDPQRQAPHSTPDQVLLALEEYYARLYAVQGGPVESALELRRPAQRPGKPSKEFYAAMEAWADQKAWQATEILMTQSACHNCHQVSVDTSRRDAARWQVVPVHLNAVWMPKARFDHRAHQQMECGSCHLATTSASASDVLMPDLASCQQCHGGEHSALKIATGCVGCHAYH